nr:SGNH/GDSL hydrolase family protein [uncultured Enterobacter sp.]
MEIRNKVTFAHYDHPISVNKETVGNSGETHARNFQLAAKMIGCRNNAHYPVITQFKRLLVLGDSLSDSTGRMKSKSVGMVPAPLQHYDGRFTNGFTWVDFLSSPGSMTTTLINKAEGAATCASYSKLNPLFFFFSNMARQIRHLTFTKDDLVMVSLGANDYGLFGKKDVDKVVSEQCQNIRNMISKGAKNIIVMGVVDLSKTAYSIKHSAASQEKLHDLSTLHNATLRAAVDKIKSTTNANILYIDTDTIFDDIIQQSHSLHYDTQHAFNQTSGLHADELNISPPYIFNDRVHPTQEVHAIFAAKIHEAIVKHFGHHAPARRENGECESHHNQFLQIFAKSSH